VIRWWTGSKGLARFADVYVEMAPARLGAMRMAVIFEFNRNSNKASVAHAALGDYMPRELPDVGHRAPQHRYLHAAVVIPPSAPLSTAVARITSR
jgi:hypothetical protein